MSGFEPMLHALEALHAPAERPTHLTCPAAGCFIERRDKASEGTLTRCPRCGEVAAFRGDGTLRPATEAERAHFEDPGPEAA